MKHFWALLFLLCAVPALAQTTTFTPLVKGFTWLPSSQGINGPLPSGEAISGFTIGIRLASDTTHGPFNYQYFAVMAANTTSCTPAQLATALKISLPPGNYYASIDQTDLLGTSPSTSGWAPEIAFSIPGAVTTVQQPLSPTSFAAG